MGVPAFYRWLREKYSKCIDNAVEEPSTASTLTDEAGRSLLDWSHPNPNGVEFDNLYLDMNGIIHPCVHPEDGPAPDTLEAMFSAITAYIDRIVAVVRPRKVLFMAIDGVAPRAKMNQQRSRRFKTALEIAEAATVAAELRARFAARGAPLPPPKPAAFDHNVITPGTMFMDRLAAHLRYYITARIQTHPAWRNLRVVLSDANTPGEGEHKIMEFVRQQRASPGFHPRVRHALHGLDADLIMLGLATHEPHFSILREEVLPPKGASGGNACFTCGQEGHRADSCEGKSRKRPEADGGAARPVAAGPHVPHKPLQFLHLSILREYLDLEFRTVFGITDAGAAAPAADAGEFGSIRAGPSRAAPAQPAAGLPFAYDLERAIDDFVFLCFFVGNDFLPHLPSLDIRDGAIDLLQGLYFGVLPTLGGYLTHNGNVHLARVDALLARLGTVEEEIFRRMRRRTERDETFSSSRADEAARRPKSDRAKALLEIIGDNKQAAADAAADVMQSLASASAAGMSTLGSGGVSAAVPRAASDAASGMIPGLAGAQGTVVTESTNKNAAASMRAALLGGVPKRPRVDGEAVPVGDTTAPVAPSEAAEAADPAPLAPTVSRTSVDRLNGVLESLQADGGGDALENSVQHLLNDAIKAALDAQRTHDEVRDEVQLGVAGWRERYYCSKFGANEGADPAFIRRVCQSYLEGLIWVFRYYYQGVASWKWFYPFHYAPFASDLRGLASYNITFELGRPFRPLDQLMAVLPAASSHALPPACAALMTSPTSPVVDFYPERFLQDPNGKKFAWMWVVLLPFIDEVRLVSAIDSVASTFTVDERRRNETGTEECFVHAESPLGRALAPLAPTADDATVLAQFDAPARQTAIAAVRQAVLENENAVIANVSDPAGSGDATRVLTPAISPATTEALSMAGADVLVLRPDVGDAAGKGLSARLVRLHHAAKSGYAAPLGATYAPPLVCTGPRALPPIPANKVIALGFLPPERRAHLSQLLPGAPDLPRVITDSDNAAGVVPRLSRGMTVADLVGTALRGGGGGGGPNYHGGRGGAGGAAHHHQPQPGFFMPPGLPPPPQHPLQSHGYHPALSYAQTQTLIAQGYAPPAAPPPASAAPYSFGSRGTAAQQGGGSGGGSGGYAGVSGYSAGPTGWSAAPPPHGYGQMHGGGAGGGGWAGQGGFPPGGVGMSGFMPYGNMQMQQGYGFGGMSPQDVFVMQQMIAQQQQWAAMMGRGGQGGGGGGR